MTPDDGAPSLDMDPATFRAAAHVVVDVMADYLEGVGSRSVFPPVEEENIGLSARRVGMKCSTREPQNSVKLRILH